MIKLVGIKRFVVVSLLLAINLAAVAVYFFSIDPELQEAQGQLAALNGEISELQTKNAAIKQDIEFLKENIPKYNALRDNGFFSE